MNSVSRSIEASGISPDQPKRTGSMSSVNRSTGRPSSRPRALSGRSRMGRPKSTRPPGWTMVPVGVCSAFPWAVRDCTNEANSLPLASPDCRVELHPATRLSSDGSLPEPVSCGPARLSRSLSTRSPISRPPVPAPPVIVLSVLCRLSRPVAVS